jgi:adenosylcobinamide kinase/adenosylcobinamide-phosphate guanylyltransferase
MIVFISGGVRSGKSQYAEHRAKELFSMRRQEIIYIATSNVYDTEMQSRVQRHQLQRLKDGVDWTLYEQHTDLGSLIPTFQASDVILLDCVTTLLSNELFIGWDRQEENWRNPLFVIELENKLIELFTQMAEASYTVFVVSNDLTFDLPINNEGTQVYMKLLGRIHEKIVSLAHEAILVEYGLPLFKKGEEIR